jgi:hypothetical protein
MLNILQEGRSAFCKMFIRISRNLAVEQPLAFEATAQSVLLAGIPDPSCLNPFFVRAGIPRT